jgi:hypothetical protein
MSLTDLLKTLVTLIVGILPSNLLQTLIGNVINQLESLVSQNAIEHALLLPLLEAIKASLGITIPPAVTPVTNIDSTYIFPTPAIPQTGYVPGDLGNRVNSVSDQLSYLKIPVTKIDVPTVDKILFVASGWQAQLSNYLATIK